MDSTTYLIIIFGAGIFVGSITYLFGYKAGKAYQLQKDIYREKDLINAIDRYKIQLADFQARYYDQMIRAGKAEKLSDFWRDQFLARYPLPDVEKGEG